MEINSRPCLITASVAGKPTSFFLVLLNLVFAVIAKSGLSIKRCAFLLLIKYCWIDILVYSSNALALYQTKSRIAVSNAVFISLGLALYIATYFGLSIPKARFLITIQKSDTSLSVAESPVPISMASIPATYRFFRTFPLLSTLGSSKTIRSPVLTSRPLTFDLPSSAHSKTNLLGLMPCLCTRISVNRSETNSELKILSPCLSSASSGVKQCSAQ